MNKKLNIALIIISSIAVIGVGAWYYIVFMPEFGPGGMPKDGYNQPASSNPGTCDFDISNKNYISKDPKVCAIKEFGCQADQKPFSDKCGCGCEIKKDETISTNNNLNGESYLSCGCGCCGGEENSNTECLYHSRGDNLDEIIKQDKESSQDTNCSLVGCSIGTLYKYCD